MQHNNKHIFRKITLKAQSKAKLAESMITEATGDKTAKVEVEVEERDNVIAIKRLAGL